MTNRILIVDIEEQNVQLQQEIAERKQAEETLREDEERFKDASDWFW